MNAARPVTPLKAASVVLCGCDGEELRPVSGLLNEAGCQVYHAETIEQLDQLAAKENLDAIIIHVCPSRQQFLPILGRPDLPPVIPLLGHTDRHLYLELLRRGAFDCVPLPVQRDELRRVLSLAIEDKRSQLTASHAA